MVKSTTEDDATKGSADMDITCIREVSSHCKIVSNSIMKPKRNLSSSVLITFFSMSVLYFGKSILKFNWSSSETVFFSDLI